MSYHTGELDHRRSFRSRQGIKEEKFRAKVTHNPSTANPGDTLVVRMPKLTPDRVMFPNSFNLTYDYKSTGDAASDIPDHLTNAIIERFSLKIGSKTVEDISNFNHLAVYKDFWYPQHMYEKELTDRGIQSEATKKKRHNITGAAADVLASVHKERYVFPLGRFLTEAAFNPLAIQNDIEFHLKLASGEYTLSNICIEYDYVDYSGIANEIKNKYGNYMHLINNYESHTTKTIDKSESSFEININAAYESLRSILILFKDDENVNLKYNDPKIKNIKIDIDGNTNQLFSSDYLPAYSYETAKHYFNPNGKFDPTNINQEHFYTDKFCLVIDLRTINDERSSGIGRMVKDYIKLKISKDATTDDLKAYVYLVSDKAISFENNQISTIEV